MMLIIASKVTFTGFTLVTAAASDSTVKESAACDLSFWAKREMGGGEKANAADGIFNQEYDKTDFGAVTARESKNDDGECNEDCEDECDEECGEGDGDCDKECGECDGDCDEECGEGGGDCDEECGEG